MDNRPIGVFDSGLGGLTAVKAIRQLLPDENIIYFGDTARMPYGVRTPEQLKRMARQDLDFAADCGAKAVLAACGTVSSTAGDVLAAYPLPVVGVMLPGIRALTREAENGHVGVIATDASIKSGVFSAEFHKLCPGKSLLSIPCQDFVTLIESGHTECGDPLLDEAVARYLTPLRDAGVTSLLLGCTHFGIIAEAILACVGRDVRLISASEAAAQELCTYLTANELTGGEGRERFFTSGSTEEFARRASIFLGRSIDRVEQAPLMEAE